MSDPYTDLLAQPSAATGAAGGDPYGALLGDDTQQQRFKSTLNLAVSVPPEQAAQQRNLAKQLKTPVAAVEALPDDAKRAAAVQTVEANTANAPVLRRKYTEADFAKLAHDDSGVLSSIESVVKGLGKTARYLVSADDDASLMRDVAAGYFGAGAGMAGLFRAGTETVAPVLDFLEADPGKVGDWRVDMGGNPIRRLAEGFAQIAQQSNANQKYYASKTEGNWMGGLSSGVQSLTQNVITLPMALLTGGESAALTAMASMTGGNSYEKAREAGRGVYQSLAYGASDAVVEYATERLPMRQLLGDLKAGAGLFQTLIKNAALEVPGEQIATILQDANEWATLNPEKSVGDYLRERPDAAIQTLIATLVGTGGQVSLMHAVQKTIDNATGNLDEMQRAEQFGQQLEVLFGAANESALRIRAPDTFAEAVQAMADENGGAPSAVYMDARTLGEVLDQSGLTPEQLSEMLPSVVSQLQDAIAQNGTVEIPVGELAAAVPGTPLEQSLLPHLRSSPEALSQMEAQDAQSQAGEFIKNEAERVMAQAADRQALEQSADAVRTTILDQLNKTARFRPEANAVYADMVRAFYATMAQRTGVTPEELYARYPLRVAAEGAGQLAQGGGKYAALPKVKQFADLRIKKGTENEKIQADSAYADEPSGFLSGVREVKLTDLTLPNEDFYTRPDEAERIQKLAEQIKKNGYITPVLVTEGTQSKSLRLAEGQHRARALRLLGYDSVPARVALPIAYFEKSPKELEQPGTRATFSPEQMLIVLGQNADLSSFLHESGHFFLEVLADLGTQPGAPEQITKDWATTLGWFGIKGTEQVGGAESGEPLAQGVNPASGYAMQALAYSLPDDAQTELFGENGLIYYAKLRPFENAQQTMLGQQVEGLGERAIRVATPIPAEKLAELELVPASPEAREALAANLGADGMVAALGKNGQISLITPSAKEPGKFQRTIYDRNGPVSDAQHETLVDAVLAMADGGYSKLLDSDRAERLISATLAQGAEPTAPGAPIQVKRTPQETWAAMTLDQKRPYHERWAESVEQYFFEGKAPSVELRGVFDRFRTWLTSVYKSLKRFLAMREQTPGGQAAAPGELNQSPQIDEMTGLPLNADGTVTVYHHTSAANADAIRKTGKLKAAAEPDVYVTSRKETDTGYGDTAVAIRVKPELLQLDDEFPDGRMDFRIDAGKPGGSVRVQVGEGALAQSATFPLTREQFLGNPKITKASNASDLAPRELNSTAKAPAEPFMGGKYTAKFSDAGVTVFDGEKPVASYNFGDTLVVEKKYRRQGIAEEMVYQWRKRYPAPAVATTRTKASQAVQEKVWARIEREQTLAQSDTTQAGPLGLSDEVRQVMDRLLATDEQIAEAERVRQYGLLFKSPEEAGMTPEQWAKYISDDEKAHAEALNELGKKSLKNLGIVMRKRMRALREVQADMAEKRKAVEAEAAEQIAAEPVYQAMRWLKKGEMVTAEGEEIKVTDGFKLDAAAVNAIFPESMVGRPDMAKLRGMMRKTEGMDPSIVAEMFGFRDAAHLITSIVEAFPQADQVQGLTDQMMLERYGEDATPRGMERAADAAVHNENRARVLAAEMAAVNAANNARAPGTGTRTVNAMVEAAKQFAANLVGRKLIKDLKPNVHTAAETRAAKAAEKALAKGDTAGVIQAKRDQLLNFHAARATNEARIEAAKVIGFFKKVATAKDDVVGKTRDIDVVKAAQAILAAYGVGTKGQAAAEYLAVLERNDPAMFAAVKPSIEAALINAKPVDQLTLDELRALNEEVQALWYLAKRSRQMEVDGNLLDRQDIEDDLKARMQVIGIPASMPGDTSAITPAEQRALKLKGYLATARRVESWARGLDGSQGIGPFTRYVWQPVKEAANAYRSDKARYLKAFRDLLKAIEPTLTKRQIEAPELNYTFGKDTDGVAMTEMLHALLHTGNESNKRKLLLGRKWATENEDGTLDTRRWDAFVQRMVNEGILQPVHFDFAQGVWDLLEQTKPLAQKAHRDVFGRYFAEVIANEFVDPFGVKRRGGYVPAQADPRIVSDAATKRLMEDENASMQFAFPSTNKGFTKGRVEYNRPLMLDLRSIAQHIDKVLLFSHMEQPVRDVRKVLTAKGVAYGLNRIDPVAFDNVLTPWLNRAAKQQVATPAPNNWQGWRFWTTLRNRAGMAAMFGNVANAVQQFAGFSLAAVRVKPSQLMGATAQYVANPKQTAEMVASKSVYMSDRLANEVANMNDAINEILINPSVLQSTQRFTAKHAYFLQSAIDNVMGPIIWTGAYNQALAEGMAERDAIRKADAAVRETQGSTAPEDVSSIEGGTAFGRLFNQFAGYFNMQANLLGTEFQTLAREMGLRKGVGRGLYVLTFGFLVNAWVAEAIMQLFKGGPDDDDKDGEYLDDWLKQVFGWSLFRNVTAAVPVFGQGINALVNATNDKPYDDRLATSPAISMLESAAKAPVSVYKAIVEDGKVSKAIKDVGTLIALTVGIPLAPVTKPLGYVADVEQGKVSPTSPADAVRGAVTGAPSGPSKNR